LSDLTDSPSKNQQFAVLNTFRRERAVLDVYLISGLRLRGRIRSFDQFSMVLETGHGDAFLYHHAVSSVGRAQGKSFARRPHHDVDAPEPPPVRAATEPAQVQVVRKVSRRLAPRDDSDR
jgi:host factor-I protein